MDLTIEESFAMGYPGIAVKLESFVGVTKSPHTNTAPEIAVWVIMPAR
jgi:hypothetical protein